MAIARALVNEPSIILADEPTGNLDSKSGAEIMRIFQDLNEEQGITIIFVTHEPEIAEHTRRIVRLLDGHIVSDSPVKNPRRASKRVYSLSHGDLTGNGAIPASENDNSSDGQKPGREEVEAMEAEKMAGPDRSMIDEEDV